MDEQDVIREWKRGLKKETIAKEYARVQNNYRKKRGEQSKMSLREALAIVEPVIFEYQRKVMKGE